MTATTQHGDLLSLEQWAALGEDNSKRYELVEGVLVVSPKSRLEHQRAIVAIALQLVPQLPDGWHATAEPELLVRAEPTATIRIPDLLVECSAGGPRATPDDVALVIEILSASTQRTDLVRKRHEYAAAGIPNYWIVDLDTSRIQVLTLDGDTYVGDWTDNEAAMADPFTLTATV